MGTYSFLDVKAGVAGPGGGFSFGSDSGAAEEGISIEMAEDKNTMTTGAGGEVMHSLHAGKSGKVTVRLLKTSPVNQKLSAMYNIQTISSAAHGQNVISIRNPVSGDSITAVQCAFTKLPNLKYAKDGDILEWVFDAGIIDTSLGGGLLSNFATFAAGVV